MAMTDSLVPVGGRAFPPITPNESNLLGISPIVLGAGVFGYDYNTSDTLTSSIPTDTLRLALRYGINTIDTSPYYTVSETVLGTCFNGVKDEFPRESYRIISKAGRYGRTREDGFDYSPERIRKSITKSLELMGTTYLDGCYMHDVEFVAEIINDSGEGGIKVKNGELLESDLARWGCGKGDEGKIHGPGDQKVLDAIKTLFELKKEGVIRAIGFSAFPLPTMLRLARLVVFHLGQSIDIMQSYCHHTLQNDTLSAFLPLFHQVGVKQVMCASPLSMGLLRSQPGPQWHPASEELQAATKIAAKFVGDRNTTLEKVSLGFGFSSAARLEGSGSDTPIVVGLSKPSEVHETMEIYNSIYGAGKESLKGRSAGEGLSDACKEQRESEAGVTKIFKDADVLDLTWACGLPAKE